MEAVLIHHFSLIWTSSDLIQAPVNMIQSIPNMPQLAEEFSCIYVVDYKYTKYRQECNWNAATLLPIPFCALKPSGLPGAYTYSQRTRPQFSMTKLSARSWCGSLEASPSLLINYNWLLAFKNESIFIFRTFIPDDRPVHHEIWIFPFFGISGSLIWLIYVK